jgi:bilirubin oxidase
MRQLLTGILLLSFSGHAQNQLHIPPVLQGNSINLSLETGFTQFYPGPQTATMGANGALLGPTLRLDKNQQVTINVTNSLGEPTTVHWHGMHVSPLNDGGPHIVIPSGSTWSPSFEVLDWAATYWYHPHLHHHTNEHVLKGIAGMIIVNDPIESALNLPRDYGVEDFPIVVQSKAFDVNNQILIHSALDTSILVNGTVRPFINAPAQMVRMRLLNGSSERYYNFGFTGNHPFSMIGSDGGLLAAPVALTRIMLAPGERAEIVVDLTSFDGQSIQLRSFNNELPNGIYGALQPGIGAGQTITDYSANPLNGANFNVLDIHVAGTTANPVTVLPSVLTTHNPWQVAAANETRQLTFTPVNMGPTAIQGPFFINGTLFDMNVINYEIPFENIEIWELTNSTPISHPFHIHDVNFYVLDINGVPPPTHLAGRKDVIHVPGGNGVVRFITKFETFYDNDHPYMYHCHMLTHEDDGMMGQFIVKAPCLLQVVQQPQDASVAIGDNAVFTVGVSDPSATFQWQSDIGFGFQNLTNAGQYSGVTTSSLTVSNVSSSNNNQLFRCMINHEGCNYSTDVVSISISTSVNDIADPLWMVFPNPSNGKFTVQRSSEVPVRYVIYDLTGRMMTEGQIVGNQMDLNFEALSQGTYLMSVDDSRVVVKLVRN